MFDLRAFGLHLLLGAVHRTAGRVMARTLSPAALAWKLRTQTTPAPLTPAAPGGREALMLMEPGPSSRWTSATALPIAAQKVSVIHVDQRKFGWIVLNLQGNRSYIRSAAEHHRNLEGGSRSYGTGGRTEEKVHTLRGGGGVGGGLAGGGQ